MDLTARQQKILEFIEAHHEGVGIMPSTREIQQHFGFASQTAAMNHLRALQRKGAIRRLAGKARAVAVIARAPRSPTMEVPIFGQIPAGLPQWNEQEVLGRTAVDLAFAGISASAKTFALKVRGDSMIGAHIVDGDLVVLEVRPPGNGDIVAALIDGETTLKRFLIRDGLPFLKAENRRYPDLVPAQELVVQGVMVALMRGRG